MSEQKVLIIGGGIGGLALAQALRGAGIAYEIFERDDGGHSRAQGWCLHLQESIQAMRKFLPSGFGDVYNSAGVTRRLGLPSKIAAYDGETSERLLTAVSPGKDEPNYFVWANRASFRDWLEQEIPVQWHKKFDRYEQDSEGVTVHFADGSSSRGSVLVAADGSSSHVRQQLLGHEAGKSSVAPLGVIFGDRRVDKAMYERFLEHANSFYLVEGVQVRVFVGVHNISEDLQSADMYWEVVWADPSVTELDNKHWLFNTSRHELRELAVKLAAGIPAELREIIDTSTDEDIVMPLVKFREFMTPDSLPEGRVTLLGDAAHSMTPFRGAGANTAVLDAMNLAEALIEAHRSNKDLQHAMKPYQDIMLPRGRQQFLATRKNLPTGKRDATLVSRIQDRFSGTEVFSA